MQLQLVVVGGVLFWDIRGGLVRVSVDWWAVLAAAAAVALIKTGLISGIPW